MTNPIAPSPLARAFAQGPTWFPQQMDAAGDRVLLVRMDEQAYRNASFLDQRMFTQQSQPQWASWAELEAADQAKRRDAHFIFHIGHVGSTLISRLLGELDGVFALREPQILRNFFDLAMLDGAPHSPWSPEQFGSRLETAIGWLSRPFNEGDRALVKATSFVSEIAGPILGETRKALFLGVSPQRYIETILAGDNSRQELAALASSRLQRLHRKLGVDEWNLWEVSEPVRAAMSWLTEMMSLEAAADRIDPERVQWLDFDEFLAHPGSHLMSVTNFFDMGADEATLSSIIESPIMTQYSKAPDHEYSSDLRERLLAEARENHQNGIAEALKWLHDIASRDENVARIVTERTRT